jgi:O-antigen ligase
MSRAARPPRRHQPRSPATSKRTRPRRVGTTPTVAATATPQPQEEAAGSAALRRALLVLVVALIVARPLVRGEDPGQLSDLSDPGSLTLTLVALVGCAGWAGWRLWSGRASLYVGPVEAGLFVVVLLYFLAVTWAPYRRAGWLTAWEWLGVALTAFLIRQLAARPEDQSALLGVFLASAVAVSAQGMYQAAYELPRQHRAALWPHDYVRQELDRRMLHPSTEEIDVLARQVQKQQVSGPYFLPSSMAVCLVLLLPGLAGAVVVCLRDRAPIWQTVLASLFVLLVGLALVLTRAWSVVAAGLVVGLLAAGLLWSRRRGGVKVGLPLAVVLGAAFLWALRRSGMLDDEIQRWGEVWPAAWQMLSEHISVGAGPSQFGLLYPRYQSETSGAPASTPGSTPLDLWADLGLPGVVAFVAVLGLVVLALVRWWRSAGTPLAPPAADAEETPDVVRWEYYLGGMIGLVLAFALRAGTLPLGDVVVTETVLAAIGSVGWFAAFGLYERLRFGVADRVAVLVMGIVALLVACLVNPGITFPSVLGPLCIALALLLAAVTPAPATWLGRQRLALFLPPPALIAGAFCYFAFVFYPATESMAAVRRARLAGTSYLVELGKQKLRDPQRVLTTQVIDPLRTAAGEDPGNVRIEVELSRWYVELWSRAPFEEGAKNPGTVAVAWAVLAQKTCPPGPDGYLAEYRARIRMAAILRDAAKRLVEEAKKNKKLTTEARKRNEEVATGLESRARNQCALAAEKLKEYLPNAPNDPEVHFLLAHTLFEAGQQAEGRKQAELARHLDQLARQPRTLTDPQRDQVNRWLGKKAAR